MGPTVSAPAVVQARMSSTRLPGKALADVEGEPLLALLLRRLMGAKRVSRIVVATSVDEGDDPIARLAGEVGAEVVRGPLQDVLARFLIVADGVEGPVVRITGDCPLIDPELVDEAIELFSSVPGCAYASNVEPRTFPDGLDVEVIDAAALRAIASLPLDPGDREHVTTAIRADPERFRHASLTAPQDMGDLRWTVDRPDDLEFVRTVVRRLGERRHHAGMEELLAAVREEPSLAAFHGRRG